MRNSNWKKAVSLLLAGTMVVGSAAAISGCGGKKKSDETVTLDIYSQVANYSGLQTGWMGDVLKDKFNVKFNIISDGNGVLQTRMEEGDLGDIVIWGNNNKDYQNAINSGLLYDWEEDDLLKDYGQNIAKNMKNAIKKNREITKLATDGKSDKLYGIGNDIAYSDDDHQSFFYNWDIRWDLYKQLGYPKVKTLEDFKQLLLDMKKICPKDDAGQEVYAVSLWPDWDKDYVMYVKATATAWYGYDELGIGLYDPTTGKWHDALEKDGPYLEMLKFYNELNQVGLVDPNSMAQTYDKAVEKVQNGGVLWSIFNYSGSLAYNKPGHLNEGKYMYSMKPEDATPLVYGMNSQGGDYVTAIGASTEYPEKCMEIINWFCSPEGKMTYSYGPKGVCWDYDKEKNTYFTDLGKQANKDPKNTKMGNGYKGTFKDGQCQAAISTWANDAVNPESNGETYNSENWKSNLSDAKTEIEQDWRDKTGCINFNEYFEKTKQYMVSPGSTFAMEAKDPDLKTTWNQVAEELKNGTWKALMSNSDKEFEKNVQNMIKKTKEFGYDKCVKWSRDQAAKRYQIEQEKAKSTGSSESK